MFAEVSVEAHVGLLAALCNTFNIGLLTRPCIDIHWYGCQPAFCTQLFTASFFSVTFARL